MCCHSCTKCSLEIRLVAHVGSSFTVSTSYFGAHLRFMSTLPLEISKKPSIQNACDVLRTLSHTQINQTVCIGSGL